MSFGRTAKQMLKDTDNAVKRSRPNGTFRLLVCGSRDWTDEVPIRKEVTRAIAESGMRNNQVLIITGSVWEDDNGVDSIIEQLCRVELGIACAAFRAPWPFADKVLNNKRAAGPMRNQWMLTWGQPHMVLAFHPYIVNSRGTKNMVRLAREAGVAVRIITGEQTVPARKKRDPYKRR